MDRTKIVIKAGLVWAIISLFSGCALIQESMAPEIRSQNQKIDQLTAKLITSKQENLTLREENKKLKADKLRLIKTNSKLKRYNQALVMKIDMLKVLDHRVEEKRKSYSTD